MRGTGRIFYKLAFISKNSYFIPMGYKIFVSYKYHDTSVYPLTTDENYLNISKVRDYVDVLEDYFDSTSHIYKGESDDEDLSYLSESTIWEKLKDRIYDSSITIVMISPNMKIPYRPEHSQWIPWEIAYSLRETTRNDRTSHSNAILAVVLPDISHQYEYFTSPFSYQQPDDCWHSGEDPVFSIIRKNMNNELGYSDPLLSSNGIFSVSAKDGSYIPSVTWNEFILRPNHYIECAVQHKENIASYKICKEVEGCNFFYG